MKKFIASFVALATALSVGLSACSDDDDDKDPKDPSGTDKELVSDNVPQAGWQGDAANGIITYSEGYEEDDINSYFAFDMKNSVCQSAVYNVVMESASQAKQIAKMLNDGSWANIDDDEEDDDYDYAPAKNRRLAFDIANSIKRIAKGMSTRANTLSIPVEQDGAVIYIALPNMKGVAIEDLRDVMALWYDTEYIVPDRVIFGKYENGVYTCSNMHGLDIDYRVETKYNADGYCTKYTTTLTLPDKNWAQVFYDTYEEQMWDFEQQFGQRPDLKLDGNKMILDAVIAGEVSREQIEQTIYSLDWINNRPLIFSLL